MADKLDFKRVLTKCTYHLVRDMEPTLILRLFTQYEYLDPTVIRDISEAQTTSERNRQIIEKVMAKGFDGYNKFKTFLLMTKQSGVLQKLRNTESVVLDEQGKILVRIVKKPRQKTFGFTIEGDGYINTTTPGSAAEECGLRVGDRIIEVNGVRVDKDGHQQVVQRVKDSGNDLTLLVQRIEVGTDGKEDKVESSNLYAQVEDSTLSDVGTDETDHTDEASTKDRGQFTHTVELEKCAHEGRVWEAKKEELKELESFCVPNNLIGEGGFGKVYSSPGHYKDWKIRIAVKKMEHGNKNESQARKSILNEILASRIKHFSIVPLLMKGQFIGCFYFVFPLYDRNLCVANKSGRNLRITDKYRILYQVASGLEYMHTEVKKTRCAIIHGDLTSKNIVLDSHRNAHILDFGLARNLKEGRQDITQTTSVLCVTPAYWPDGHTRPSIWTDWYGYGVVLLELLTGSPPFVEDLRVNLKDLFIKHREDFNGHFKEPIKEIKMEMAVEELTDLATTCFKLVDLATTCFKLEPEPQMISSVLRDRLNRFSSQYYIVPSKEGEETKSKEREKTKCVYCKINPSVRKTSGLLETCNCSYKNTFTVCIACMRKSFLNPLRCFCGKELKTTIGNGWAAMLISGTDTEPSYQRILNEEVDALGDILTSKHPFVIGIREENLFKYKQEKTSANSWKEWWESTIHALIEQKITTLLFYYTGHNSPEEGLQLGSSVSFKDLMKEELKCLKRIIFILDCCYAESADLGDIVKHKSVIRLNSSRADQTSHMTEEDGSYFTKYLKEALGGTVWMDKEICKEYSTRCRDGVIDSDSLTWYLNEQLQKHSRTISESTNQVDKKDKVLGYFIDFNTEMKFCIKGMKDEHAGNVFKKQLPKKIEDLRSELFETLLEKKYRFSKERIEPLKSFSDTVNISIVEGHKESNIRELRELNEIQTAWDQHLPLNYDLRDVKEIKQGRVMLCLDRDESQQTEDVLTALLEKADTPANVRKVPIKTIKNYKSHIQSSSVQTPGEAREQIEEIFTSLLASFLEDSSGDLHFEFLDSNKTETNVIILQWVP